MELADEPGARPLRRPWKRLILIPALAGVLGGYLASYAYPAKYTSQALVLVESQVPPQDIVGPAFSEDLAERVSRMQEQTLAQRRLLPLVERLGLAKGDRTADMVIADIRSDFSIEPVITDAGQLSSPRGGKAPARDQQNGVPGFWVYYVASSPKEARDVCAELTSMLIMENISSREARLKETIDFLRKEAEGAKQELETMDASLSERTRHEAASKPGGLGSLGVQATEREAARKHYADLLGKLKLEQVAQDAESAQLGEQWRLVFPASFPTDPAFPDRFESALGGLMAGLIAALVLVLRLKFRRAKS